MTTKIIIGIVISIVIIIVVAVVKFFSNPENYK